VNAALREAEFGNRVQASRDAIDALGLAPTPGLSVEILAALALARAGDVRQAQKLAEKLDRRYTHDTVLRIYWLPTLRASLELDHGNGMRAIELLHEVSPYELGQEPGDLELGTMYPIYVRGLAYLKTRRGGQAAAKFQKIFEHRGLVQNFPLGALAHLQLARARILEGDVTGAKTAYQDFLALWKDADPYIPILKEAKAEYAKLQ
jgi:eukaryotic-like serine/threonine-protein kinase